MPEFQPTFFKTNNGSFKVLDGMVFEIIDFKNFLYQKKKNSTQRKKYSLK
jgi:hypothetical protein